ncbi:XdhC family protein [Paenibacillus sp. CGMCC 1.16610]|uniref:XdhC/CoxI family protein n=1 Tax=Paenibacillus anseongense TaxID=2682845 RepID=A0ABW9U0V9_9BACL|nr:MULTISPECIES: XdhC/CoxI family protein [Paenibacillus]MBA2943635.1 XdhC family protein [Paenibacillus sp. CGMCC 1.16610]MVQ33131.1 XdhC/CoxI family protein [Paenibacillus anseongense]
MEAYDILQAVEDCAQSAVLATVIHVEGHAYRKQGAMMMLLSDGSLYGSISPGCLEADLSGYVPLVEASQKPQMVEYDMRPADDFGWGETIGCGGLIRILLEPVTGELLVYLLTAKAAVDRGEVIVLTRSFAEGYSDIQYKLSGIDKDSADCQSLSNAYVYAFKPKPRVIVFGANQDAIPLVGLAISSGFRVVVADWRDAYCTQERFPDAETVVAFPGELVKKLRLTADDYVVVMSHQFDKDAEFVQAILKSSLRYLGIMGSRSRSERLLDGAERPEWVHYPVGLNIGSEGPIENAISIVAELISKKRGVRKNEEWSSSIRSGDIQGCRPW